eukprot:m.47134 g.47134  ORF g.47134 m.47134 type:complete len:300 (+) comp17605_c0_seq2:57-956(+)
MEEIIDVHQHFWDTDKYGDQYPWLQELPENDRMTFLKKSYLVADFEQDTDGLNVIKTVHVQGERTDSLAETKWLSEEVSKNEKGYPHAIVAFADLTKPTLSADLDAQCKYNKVRGIRQLLNWSDDVEADRVAPSDLLNNPAWRSNLTELEKRNLLFEFHIHPHQMPAAAEVCKSFPKMTFVLDHIGCPNKRKDSSFDAWVENMKVLAGQPNIHVKVSGLIHPGFTDTWTTESLAPWVKQTIEIFGVDRCLFASNFPVDRACGSYVDMLKAVKSIFNDMKLSAADQKKIFHDNAVRVYRL